MERRGAHAAAFVFALIASAAIYDGLASWAVAERDAADPEIAAARRVYTFLESVRGGEGPPRVIVLGASDAREAIDGHLVDHALGIRGLPHETFNLAVGGDTPLRRLPELPALVEARPALVVYFVGLHMFRDHGRDGLVNRFAPIADLARAPPPGSEAAALLGPAHLETLDPAFGERLSGPRLSLERAAIRGALFDALGAALGAGDGASTRAREAAAKAAHVKDPWMRGDETSSAREVEEGLAEFPVGWESLDEANVNLRALELILATLAREGIPALVVESPLNPAFEHRLPPDALMAARARLAEVARTHGAVFVPSPPVVTPADFADHVHANRAGRLKMSAHISGVLAERLEGEA